MSPVPWRRIERRLRCICSIYGAKIVCFANHGCKCDGRCCETYWFCSTSRRRNISLYPSQHGGRVSFVETYWVKISRYLHTFSTTHVAHILVQHGRPSCSFCTKSLWSPIIWIVMEVNLRKFYCDLDWEQIPNWECMFVLRKQGLINIRGWH